LSDKDGNESALWPEKHSVEDLHRLQTAKPYTFSGQYQQDPCAAEGNIFKPDYISIIDAVPIGTTAVRAWDLGATDGSGDYTVGFKMGKMPDGRWLIMDIIREQFGPEAMERALRNTAQRDTRSVKIRLPQDPGQAGKTQVKYLTKMLAGYSVVSKPISGDKVLRAEPFAAQVNVGNVVMMRAEWNEGLLAEMRAFDRGKYDDMIDAGSDAFSELTDSAFFGDCSMEENAPDD
jgi:predicted phage terminase large subunit-like protein